MVTAIIDSGKPFQDRTSGLKYEAQSGTDHEFVSGRIATKGTASTQAKLATFGSPVIGVFDKQTAMKGENASGDGDDNYVQGGQNCIVKSYGPFTFNGTLDDGQTVTKGDKLGFESTTGKLTLYDGSTPWVAISMEDKAASGSDLDLQALYAPWHLSYVEETLVVGTDVITCSYSNIANVTYVEHIEGDVVYQISHISTGTPTDNICCVFARGASTITFHATDLADAQTVRVGYWV